MTSLGVDKEASDAAFAQFLLFTLRICTFALCTLRSFHFSLKISTNTVPYPAILSIKLNIKPSSPSKHNHKTKFAVPQVVRICTQFIEEHGIVNGIYRASGISSNIQRIK